MDEVTKKMLQQIKDEEKQSPILLIPQLISRKLLSYHSILFDLIFIEMTIEKMIRLKKRKFITANSDVRKIYEPGLWYTIIILYGKCFTDASKASNSRLDRKECFASNELALINTHDALMELRHNFIAHRGDSGSEKSVAYVVMNGKNKGGGNFQLGIRAVRAFSPSIEELRKYAKLIRHLISFVEDKKEKQSEKISKKLSEYSTSQLMALLI